MNTNFDETVFTNEVLAFAPEANKKDSTYWNTLRPVPLTREEFTDYIKKDSIQTLKKSKIYRDSVDTKNNTFKFGNLISEECKNIDVFGTNMYRGASSGLFVSTSFEESRIVFAIKKTLIFIKI